MDLSWLAYVVITVVCINVQESQHHQQRLLQSPQQLPSSFQRPQTARPAAAPLIARYTLNMLTESVLTTTQCPILCTQLLIQYVTCLSDGSLALDSEYDQSLSLTPLACQKMMCCAISAMGMTLFYLVATGLSLCASSLLFFGFHETFAASLWSSATLHAYLLADMLHCCCSESASARRQRTALLEDMMTIRGL